MIADNSCEGGQSGADDEQRILCHRWGAVQIRIVIPGKYALTRKLGEHLQTYERKS